MGPGFLPSHNSRAVGVLHLETGGCPEVTRISDHRATAPLDFEVWGVWILKLAPAWITAPNLPPCTGAGWEEAGDGQGGVTMAQESRELWVTAGHTGQPRWEA